MPTIKGTHFTEEHKRKIGLSNKGKTLGHKFNLGHYHSKESKLKMRLVKLNSPFFKERMQKLLLSHLGKKQSDATKEKIRMALLGNKYALGHRHNAETKKKISVGHLMEKNINWRGGTSKNRKRINTADWFAIQRKIKIRDGFKCAHCGVSEDKQRLNVHHIIHFPLTQDNSPKNLVTLCVVCHINEHYKWKEETAFLRIKAVV